MSLIPEPHFCSLQLSLPQSYPVVAVVRSATPDRMGSIGLGFNAWDRSGVELTVVRPGALNTAPLSLSPLPSSSLGHPEGRPTASRAQPPLLPSTAIRLGPSTVTLRHRQEVRLAALVFSL